MDKVVVDRPEVSVVYVASDDTRTLRRMLTNVKELATSLEVIVVSPKCVDTSYLGDESSWIDKIVSPSIYSYDEGRALGARHARGETVLFLDERVDFSLPLWQQYVDAVRNGADVAVTVRTQTSTSAKKKKPLPTRYAYRLLNHLLGHTELGTGTLSRIPFACSRKALKALGHECLRTPPIAYVKAAWQKLVVVGVHPDSAIKWTDDTRISMVKSTRQLLREHAYAIQLLVNLIGPRGGMPDGDRYRDLLHIPGELHLRSVFYPQPREDKGGVWGGKRKKKQTGSHKKR